MAGPERELAAVLSRLHVARPRVPFAANRDGRTTSMRASTPEHILQLVRRESGARRGSISCT